MMGMVRARYRLEFKQEAVLLVRRGQTVSSAAKSLGLSEQTLHNWLKAETAERLREVAGKAISADQMETARLKAELAKTRMERNILKVFQNMRLSSGYGATGTDLCSAARLLCAYDPEWRRYGVHFSDRIGAAGSLMQAACET